MDIRPALLNSAIARRNVPPAFQSTREVAQALTTIDRVADLHDALEAASKTISPHETQEARAMRYENQYTKAVAKAKDVTGQALIALEDFDEQTKTAAIMESGLGEPPANAVEIRAALRSMPKGEREQAISKAFEDSDTDILASVFRQNPVVWGGVKAPIANQFDLFIDQAAPQAIAARKASEAAFEGLRLAGEAFAEAATKWRQSHLAAKGQQQQQEFEEAGAKLDAALEG